MEIYKGPFTLPDDTQPTEPQWSDLQFIFSWAAKPEDNHQYIFNRIKDSSFIPEPFAKAVNLV